MYWLIGICYEFLMKEFELLCPVGNYEMCVHAVHNGADAIYVGMPEFNARGRSHDHSWEELKDIIDLCHLYGVKVHLAFNILIFENEIERAIKILDQAVKLGPDALIVQDLGLISIVNQRYPHLEIHASTQMTVTNHEAIELLDDLNIKRFVLGRENTIEEIKLIKDQTDKELEVFVHGALCVAYSGQCFTSESLGGRSANRGQCAQSCRFDYEIFVDGKKRELANIKYLVSPKDLCGIADIPKLKEIGVDSFKIEGRLKSNEYVATAAKAYKEAIIGDLNVQEVKPLVQKLSSTFSRGFYNGWLDGVAHQKLVDGVYKSHKGVSLGKVLRVSKKDIEIQTEIDIENGDGIQIFSQDRVFGEKIFHIKSIANKHFIKLGPKIKLSDIKPGFDVFLNRDESLIKEVRQSVTNKEKMRKVSLRAEVNVTVGKPIHLKVYDDNKTYDIFTSVSCEAAQKRPLTKENIESKIFGLSNTVYTVSDVNYPCFNDVYIHNNQLKQMKKDLIDILNSSRTQVSHFEINSYHKKTIPSPVEKKYGLNVLLRKKSQLAALTELSERNQIDKVILDYEFGKDYFSSVKELKKFGFKVFIATTRILKPKEYHNFRLIERCQPDGILVRNLGALNYFKDSSFELIGDFSLNCANSWTFNYLINKGLSSLCLSYDLNLIQLDSMLSEIETSRAEITVHQYMPEFHMEHCVFAAFLSKGNSFRDCGKPCEKHDVYLKDMYGNHHEIKADQECRNTMFNSKVYSTLKYIKEWQDKGVKNFRIEALHESADELKSKLSAYIEYLENRIDLKESRNILGGHEKYGLSELALTQTKEYKSKKQIR